MRDCFVLSAFLSSFVAERFYDYEKNDCFVSCRDVDCYDGLAQAGQKVSDGSQWNIGWGQYEAHVKPALIQMTSVHEGEQQAFVLVPKGPTEFYYAAAPEELGEDPHIVPQFEGGTEESGGFEGVDLL